MENKFVDFVLSPGYRIQRHLLFIIALAFLATDVAVSQPGFDESAEGMVVGLILYNILIIGIQYLNVKAAVPHLLLKNKFLKYFLFLFSMVILTLIILIVFQANYYQLRAYNTLPHSYFYLAVLSSMVILTLVLMGVTAIMLFRYWLISLIRVNELESATLHSELKYLKNQINPHFLFNTLNNAHVLFKDNKKEASTLLYKLEDLLRYQINESSKDEIYLTSDISFLTDYLNLEKVRRDRFTFSINVEGDITGLQLPPLLFIPFVENAVKHSHDSDLPSYIHLQFEFSDNILAFKCENSVPGDTSIEDRPGGIGLKNIIRRLELLFPGKHQLQLTEEHSKYLVTLHINLN